jgi:membrane fusion protein, multidrug efflux system
VRRQSRDLLVEAVIANADRRLLPGMFATAQLVLGAGAQPVIPESAIKRGSESDRVFVVAAGPHLGLLEERMVTLGPGGSEGVAVLSGLRAGEHVVAPVTSDLRDGARVQLR